MGFRGFGGLVGVLGFMFFFVRFQLRVLGFSSALLLFLRLPLKPKP